MSVDRTINNIYSILSLEPDETQVEYKRRTGLNLLTIYALYALRSGLRQFFLAVASTTPQDSVSARTTCSKGFTKAS